MKTKKRNSVFETNSSSTHSIHVDKETKIKDTTLLPDEEGNIVLYGGEFGWEWRRYNDAVTKANYASIGSSGVPRDVFERALKEQTGANNIVYKFCESYNTEESTNWAYIDHQSSNMMSEFLDVHSVEEIKNWIFNPNCWLITGNDNSTEPVNIKDFPVTDENGNIKEYEYTHKFYLPGKDKEIYFNGKNNESAFLRYIEEICDWDTEFDSNGDVIEKYGKVNKEGVYRFETWQIPKNLKLINLKTKTFILLNSEKLQKDVESEYSSYQNMNVKNGVMLEKHKTIKNDWELKNSVRQKLLTSNISNYTIKKNYVIKKLTKKEIETVSEILINSY